MDHTLGSAEHSASGRRRWAEDTMAILERMAPEQSQLLRAFYFDRQSVRDIAAAAFEPERRIAQRVAEALQSFALALAAA